MTAPTDMDLIRKALQNHGRGVIADADLAAAVFPCLTESNLREYLMIVSRGVAEQLMREAQSAPRTEQAWQDLLRIPGAPSDGRDTPASRRAEADFRARYRRGVEVLRGHIERQEANRPAPGPAEGDAAADRETATPS